MSELVFNITQEPDGGYVAVAVNESIATQGDTWDELCYMVVDATKAYFHDSTPHAHPSLSSCRASAGRRVKLPRDLYGRTLADHLIRHWQYKETYQTGSHIILRTEQPSGQTPAHSRA